MAPSAELHLSEPVACLALATDLGMGQPLEQGLRTCLLAVRVGERLGLGVDELADAYYIALLELNAGTTSVILASVPLVTLTLAVVQGQERFTRRGVAGGVLALGGIAVLSFRTLEAAIPLLPLLAVIGGMVAASEAAVLVKGFPKSDPITTNAVGMSVGAAGLLVASILSREPWSLPSAASTWMAVLWLAAAGSVGLFGLFVFVIKTWKASASVYALTMMPVVAVGLGGSAVGQRTDQAAAGAGRRNRVSGARG